MKLTSLQSVVVIAVMIAGVCTSVSAQTGEKETLTLISPSRDGSVKILTKEGATAGLPKRKKRENETLTEQAPRKARVVAMPAVYSRDVRSKGERELNEKFGVSDPSIIENPGYTGFLIDALVNSRKFDVFEREDLSSAIKELDLGETEYADFNNVVKIGRVLNADYVIVPQITFLEFKPAESIPYIGKAGERLEARIDVRIKAIDVATSRLSSSSLFSSKLRRSRKQDESNAAWVNATKNKLYSNSAIEGVAGIIDVAYPIKVLLVNEDTCILNRGAGALMIDEVLNVYSPGEIMLDPDTKEVLGSFDTMVGKVSVLEVNDKTAVAKILEGSEKIEKLSICRRVAKPGVAVSPAPKLD